MTILIPDIEWCEVPAGEFIMGSNNHGSYERPCHVVNLPYGYKAAKYPITNAQYGLFVENKGYTTQRYWTEAGWAEKLKRKWTGPRSYPDPFNLPNHPVVGVSWYESVAYCRWLMEVLRYCGELAQGWQIRLPTEAEWEKAARGTDGRTYPWGEGFDPEKANGKETEVESTNALGIFPDGVSPYGCHDMAGNVWEWCATKVEGSSYSDRKFKPYPYQVENEWTADYLASETRRNVRCGSWYDVTDVLRCVVRNSSDPFKDYGGVGFRCFFVPIF